MTDPIHRQPSIERFRDVSLTQKALARAVRDALLRHKQAGNAVAVWQDGRVVWVAPEDILVEPER